MEIKKEELLNRQFIIEELGKNGIEYQLLLYQFNGETITLCINETFNIIQLEYKERKYSEINWIPVSNCKILIQLDNLIELFKTE